MPSPGSLSPSVASFSTMTDPDNAAAARERTDRSTLLITVPSATIAFGVAFNLGAFDTVFFDAILAVWVTATIVLIASVISPTLPPRHWSGRLVLLIPTVWVVLAIISGPERDDAAARFLFAISLIVALVALPFIAWILISAINPYFLELPNRQRGAVVLAVLFFVVVGYLFGARNDVILTCDDFKVSGNDLPANCVEVEESGG